MRDFFSRVEARAEINESVMVAIPVGFMHDKSVFSFKEGLGAHRVSRVKGIGQVERFFPKVQVCTSRNRVRGPLLLIVK